MPKYIGFDSRTEKMTKDIVKKAGDLLANAQCAHINGNQSDTIFNTNFKTWFGDPTPRDPRDLEDSKDSIEDIVYTLALMGGEIEHDNYTIKLGQDNGDENANVLAFEREIGHKRDLVGKIWQLNREDKKKGNPSPMTLRPRMFKMPFLDQTQQSQVQTFLHELSHFAAGTIDFEAPKCYTLKGTEHCKDKGIKIAIRNAENVGFFIQSFDKYTKK